MVQILNIGKQSSWPCTVNPHPISSVLYTSPPPPCSSPTAKHLPCSLKHYFPDKAPSSPTTLTPLTHFLCWSVGVKRCCWGVSPITPSGSESSTASHIHDLLCVCARVCVSIHDMSFDHCVYDGTLETQLQVKSSTGWDQPSERVSRFVRESEDWMVIVINEDLIQGSSGALITFSLTFWWNSSCEHLP